MGMFGSRKKTYVSSVVYNLAGDPENRPNFLKTAILSNIAYKSESSVARTLVNSYLSGPGISMPRFARWAKTSGYNSAIAQISSTIAIGGSIPEATLAAHVPHAADEQVNILVKRIGPADYSWWAEQWMLANHPEDFNLQWVADIEGQVITITMPNATTYTFVASDFFYEKTYLYFTYSLVKGSVPGASVVGPVIAVPEGGSLPSTSGWTQVSQTTTPKTMDLVKTTVVKSTFSDGRPDEESTSTVNTTGSYSEIHGVYERTTYKGDYPSDPSKTYSVKETMYQDQVGSLKSENTSNTTTEDLGGGVTKTTVTTVTTQSVRLDRSYHIDSVETLFAQTAPAAIRIYTSGGGIPEWDALFVPTTNTGVFYPFIPVRLDNKFVSPTFLPTIYEAAKKGYKKVFGKNGFDNLIELVKDNESLDDIDYAYIIFGVSLNVVDMSALKYVYTFFKAIMDSFAAGSPGEYDAYRVAWNQARNSVTNYTAWKIAQGNPASPLYGTPAPQILAYPSMPNREINIKNTDQFNITISWNALGEDIGSGKFKPDAKVGDIWWDVKAPLILDGEVIIGGSGIFSSMIERSSSVELVWQETATSWRRITMDGLLHTNNIYKGKGVEIEADEAINDPEESGFIVPLHEDIFKSMKIVDRTQMATANSFLLFNCYQIVKKKWYQTGIFQVVLVIVVIVVSVVFPPAGGAAATGGVLGANAAVGAALGIAAGTLAAVIVGAVANAIAAMLIMSVIQRGAVALFGDKLGAIIGAIAAVVAMKVGGQLAAGQTAGSAFTNLASADNLLALTNAAGRGYAGYLEADTNKWMARTEDLLVDYASESNRISELYEEAFGSGDGVVIDPIKASQATLATYEPVDAFLSRTLMAGSDIVDLSYALLDNFTEISLNNSLT